MARTLVPVTSLTPPKATLTTALAGANNDLVYTARTGGSGGNSITVAYIVAGASTALSVTVAGFAITVNVATDGASAATSTAAQVSAAVAANNDANALVSVANSGADTGAGIVAALAATALAGGRFATAQPTLINGDSVNDHYITGNTGIEVIEVVSTDAAAQTVTVQFAPGAVGVASLTGVTESIAIGETRILGPFLPRLFNQNASGDVYFDPAVSNTLDFRAYEVVTAV